jgi:probable rRNA maturation factor
MKRSRPTRTPKTAGRDARFELSIGIATRAHWTPSSLQFQEWIKAALPRRLAAASIAIRIVGRATSLRLNARYRGKHKPTNVLSFAGHGRLPDGQFWLGDLVICAPVVAREARAQHKGLDAHWAHMTVHGVLHLLGMDHMRPPEARRMETKEIQILDRLGFSDPYAQSGMLTRHVRTA